MLGGASPKVDMPSLLRLLLPLFAALALALPSCELEPTGPDTGGFDGLGGGAGAQGADACPRALAVILSDYLSTQVVLTDPQGKTVSASVISTASSKTDGLSFALSGDLVLPSSPSPTGELVLVDRFGTNVITWLSPGSGEVRTQLSVGTGFDANPQDILTVSETLAFVSRFGENRSPGREPHDSGGDLLVLDPSVPQIVDSIRLPTEGGFPSRPGALIRLGDELLVTANRIALDFASAGDAWLIGLSLEDRKVTFQHVLSGLKSCSRAALSPNGRLLAMACSGRIDEDGRGQDPSESALVLFDAEAHPPVELARFSAQEIAGEVLQSSVAFASDDTLLLKTQTALGGEKHNRWLSFAWRGGVTRTLVTAGPDSRGQSKGLVYGAMQCFPGCSDLCFLTDADAHVLQRAQLEPDGDLSLLEPVRLEDVVRLPPVDLTSL